MFSRLGVLTISLFLAQAILLGCGSNEVKKEDPAAAQARLNAATSLRSYFDKSGGNFDSLSDEEKQAVIAITKTEEKAREAFGHMVLVKPGAAGGKG